MRLFLKQKEYFSVEEYAEALVQYAIENDTSDISLHVYNAEEDRVRGINAVAGIVPYKPYDRQRFINAVQYLEELA